jgi:2-polyprenyl-3-methyl-5-hydroxy-6-metoxy-1,4-benzoquinol methylase
MKKLPTKPNKCILCGSTLHTSKPYLGMGGENLIRDFAYLLPMWVLRIIAWPNATLRENANSVIVNKKTFGDKKLFWCDSCCTGMAWPPFDDAQLNSYYRDFYWNVREQHAVYFSNDAVLPLESQLWCAQNRLDWVEQQGIKFSTAIDFGAGDCAAAYLMSKKCGLKNVVAVDSSSQTKTIARSMGLSHSLSLESIKPVDFIYSSHTIEHVADLIHTFALLESAVCDGGFLFLETPNVADRQVFAGLVMTPHTFLLSDTSFEQLSNSSTLRLIATETVGPEWSEHHNIASQARADLRVLFKKVSS